CGKPKHDTRHTQPTSATQERSSRNHMKLHASGPHAADSAPPETGPDPTVVGLSPPATRTVEQSEDDEPTDPVPEHDERVLRPDDFVFLSGKGTCPLIRTGEIWLLEACGGRTRV